MSEYTWSGSAIQALSAAIETRVREAMDDEDDLLNFETPVVSAREKLREARSTAGPAKILDVVAADGGVRDALRVIIAGRLLAVTY